MDERTTADSGREYSGPGGSIGPYLLLDLIGEGGFGVVWLGEQTSPLRRRVAIKVIKPGMDSGAVIARFEAERQALALMDHPGVARVFDAGTTKEGRPYFVMEHVRGRPIDEFCDRNELDVEARLGLFIKVCRAVQHAHQKGVIHRDLKPANVLVVESGGEAHPKVIDFGIAKAISSPLTETPYVTHVGQVIGTPEYMSPEQALSSGADVDTRTDVYSLGVLLYKLLTGTLPVDSETLRSAQDIETIRAVREREPVRPSARVASGTGDERSGAGSHTLSRRLRGELDWIVLKAMSFDRRRRYTSPEALARDVERHLAHEPVEAGPPGARYRASKFARRHRVLLVAGGAVLVALVGGLAAATYGFVRASEERDDAIVARDEANDAVQFLQDVLSAADPSDLGRDVTVRELLEWAEGQVGERFGSSPLTEARMHDAIGGAYRALGQWNDAERHLPRVYEIRKEHLGASHRDTLRAQINLAGLYQEMDRDADAREIYERLLATARRTLGDDDPIVLGAMNNLAQVYSSMGRRGQAMELQERVLEGYRRVHGNTHPDTLGAMSNLARMRAAMGMIDQAQALQEESLSGWRSARGEDDPGTLLAAHNLGLFYLGVGRPDLAEAIYRDVYERRRRVLGADHPDTFTTQINLGRALKDLGRYDESLEMLTDAFERSRRVLGDAHSYTHIGADLLLGTFEKMDVGEEHEPAIRGLVQFLGERAERGDASPAELNSYAWTLLKVKPESLRDPRAALDVARRACDRSRAAGDGDLWMYLDTYALALSMTGQNERAIETQREALSLIPENGEWAREQMEAQLAGFEGEE